MKKIFLILLVPSLLIAEVSDGKKSVEKGHFFYRNAKYNMAMTEYKNSLKYPVNRALIYFNMANCSYLMKRPWESVIYYKRVMGYAPEFYKSYLNCAKIYYELKDYNEARIVIEKSPVSVRCNEEIRILLGCCYIKLEAYAEALHIFEKIMETNSRNTTVYFLIAEANLAIDDRDSAVRIMQKAADISDSIQVHNFLGQLLCDAGRYSDAVPVYEHVISMDKSDLYAYKRLAHCYLMNKQRFLAIDTLKKALKQDEDFTEGSIFLGNLYFDMAFYDEAEVMFLKAAQRAPDRAKIYLKNIASVWFNEGKKDKIRDLISRCKKINPVLASCLSVYINE